MASAGRKGKTSTDVNVSKALLHSMYFLLKPRASIFESMSSILSHRESCGFVTSVLFILLGCCSPAVLASIWNRPRVQWGLQYVGTRPGVASFIIYQAGWQHWSLHYCRAAIDRANGCINLKLVLSHALDCKHANVGFKYIFYRSVLTKIIEHLNLITLNGKKIIWFNFVLSN